MKLEGDTMATAWGNNIPTAVRQRFEQMAATGHEHYALLPF